MLQCFLVVLMLVTCVKGESLHLVPSGPSFRVDAGNDAIMHCVLNGDSIDIGGSFSWTKDSGQTLNNTEDGHVTITLSDSGKVSTLSISGVHNGDEGTYTCSYTNVDTHSIIVEVNSDPHFKNVSEHQVLTEGTDAVVECPAFLGDPPGQMYWFRNNQFINDDRFIGEDGHLTIQNVRPEDADAYRCSLYRNGIHGSRDITVTVQAQDVLAPDIVEHHNPIQVVYGEPLDLICELEEAKNDVQYSWTIDTDFEQNHLVNTTQQLYKDPYEFLSGRYTCRAENQYGYDEELFFVKILAPPLPNPCSETPKRINEGQTVVLSHCEITSPVELSDLQFQWSKMRENGEMTEIEPDGMKYSLNHEGLLTIVKAQPSDSGMYQVNISNDLGYALHSFQLEVVDIPDTSTLLILPTGPCDSDCLTTMYMVQQGDGNDKAREVIITAISIFVIVTVILLLTVLLIVLLKHNWSKRRLCNISNRGIASQSNNPSLTHVQNVDNAEQYILDNESPQCELELSCSSDISGIHLERSVSIDDPGTDTDSDTRLSESIIESDFFILYDKPNLKDVFKELISLATYWRTIGTLLGIQEYVLDMIKSDENKTLNRFQNLIAEWLKQADPTPTWRDLADAIGHVDAAKAQEIKTRLTSFSSSGPSASTQSNSSVTDDKPKLKDVFKDLLPLATYWKTIGTLLEIEEHVLDMINSDEDRAHDCLQKMISEWLKRVDPTPTWRDLADAVGHVDTDKAQYLKTCIASRVLSTEGGRGEASPSKD